MRIFAFPVCLPVSAPGFDVSGVQDVIRIMTISDTETFQEGTLFCIFNANKA